MKIDLPPINIHRDGVIGERKKFGISEKNMSHLLGILRSKLYSNKALAVVREYCCNAWDSHLMNGDQRPIEVTLPAALDPVFKVRDHGPGMSPETVEQTYIMYGDSTSRENENAIGGMGIGSKAGFAYGDSFIVTSWNGGRKRTYSCVIDESRRGEIACIDDSECSESDHGVEICVPVLPQDFAKFQTASDYVLQYFHPRPIVNGQPLEDNRSNILFEDRDKKWFVKDRSVSDSYNPTIILGNIEYEIDSGLAEYVREWRREHGIQTSRAAGLALIAGPGDVDIAASRESLEYTERTISWIKDRLSKIDQQCIFNEVKRRIDEDQYNMDFITACRVLTTCLKMFSETGSSKKKIKMVDVMDNIKWRGYKLLQNGIPVSCLAFEIMARSNPGYDSKKFKKQLPEIPADLAEHENKWLKEHVTRLSGSYSYSQNEIDRIDSRIRGEQNWGRSICYEKTSKGRAFGGKDFLMISNIILDQVGGNSSAKPMAVLWTNKIRATNGVNPSYSRKIFDTLKTDRFVLVCLPKGFTPADMDERIPGCTSFWKNLEETVEAPSKIDVSASKTTIDDISKVFRLSDRYGWRSNIKECMTSMLVKDHVSNQGNSRYYIKFDRENNMFPIKYNIPNSKESDTRCLQIDNCINFLDKLTKICVTVRHNEGQFFGKEDEWRDAWGMDEDEWTRLPLAPSDVVAVSSNKSEQILIANGYKKIDSVIDSLLPFFCSISSGMRNMGLADLYISHECLNISKEFINEVKSKDWYKNLPRILRWFIKVSECCGNHTGGDTSAKNTSDSNGMQDAVKDICGVLDMLCIKTGSVNSHYWSKRKIAGHKHIVNISRDYPGVLLASASYASLTSALNYRYRERDCVYRNPINAIDSNGHMHSGTNEQIIESQKGAQKLLMRELEHAAVNNKSIAI